MDYKNEMMNDREAAMQNAKSAESGCATTGMLGRDMPKAVRESMTDRFRRQIERANRDRYRSAQLEELVYLLDKNPEIARILDLVDILGRD